MGFYSPAIAVAEHDQRASEILDLVWRLNAHTVALLLARGGAVLGLLMTLPLAFDGGLQITRV